MKSKASTEWSTISHPNRRARLSGNESKKIDYYGRGKCLLRKDC